MLIYIFKNFNDPRQNQENDAMWDRINNMQHLITSKEIWTLCETVSRPVQECSILNTSNLNEFNGFLNIVTYPGFAWLIRRVLHLMIGFIGPLYNWLQQFTNHYLTHCHLLPTGHSTGTILSSEWTELHYSVVLLCTPPISLALPAYKSSARTPRKHRLLLSWTRVFLSVT
jgi:hypothetical protein